MNGNSSKLPTAPPLPLRGAPPPKGGSKGLGEFAVAPLGFPRGEAGFFGNRHFGTDCQKRLMRDGVHQKVHKEFDEWGNVLAL